MSVPAIALDAAIRDYIANMRHGVRPPSFDNTVVDLRTKGTMDERAAGAAVRAVDKQCRRLFAFVRHGHPSKRLSKADQVACRPLVTRPAKDHIRFDFSQFLNRMWGAAASWVAPHKQDNLFQEALAALDKKTTTLDQDGTRRLLTHMVAAVALYFTTIDVATVVKDYALEWQKEDNRQQIALLKLPRLEANGAGVTILAKSDREKIAGAVEQDLRRSANIMMELSRDDPVLQFVSAQAEVVRPALFKVLESSGGWFNGIEFSPNGATEAVRRARENSRSGIGLWTTTTASI